MGSTSVFSISGHSIWLNIFCDYVRLCTSYIQYLQVQNTFIGINIDKADKYQIVHHTIFDIMH